MRKISELLEICKNYHKLWSGLELGMCPSATSAMEHGEMTIDECYEVEFHSMDLVDEIDQDAGYLFEALGLDLNHEPDRRQLKDWWESHINTLKEKGL